MNEDILHKRIEDAFKEIWNTPEQIPLYIIKNLKHRLRPYQQHALEHFIFVQKQTNSNVLANHLLFHMATGSGKTTVLASTILYLFKEEGYKNFLFFVNSDAIIRKTKDNLSNKYSPKYLFASDGIEINGRNISIQIVDVFPLIPEEDTIYLKLTTIQKLHRELEDPRENGLTYESITENPIILLSDEAHHINVETKKKKKPDKQMIEEKNWETTVKKIMNSNIKNKMLEFTATLDLTKQSLFEKYKDKIVFQYDLRKFMNDGYSKNVLIARANEDDNSKMLNAILLSQYRKYIAKEIDLDLKPIIMFKSQKIALSKDARDRFFDILENLTVDILKRKITRELSSNRGEKNVWEEMFEYYESADLAKVIRDLRDDFSRETVLTVDTQEIFSERDALLLNTLEDLNNPIRAIFAVAKLNEGWDVLNLYDIVRLSESASSTKNATDSEAQLIGRGARYFPFKFNGEKSFVRRFDYDNRRLSLLESLHYHTINDSAYIKNLEKSLDAAGIVTREDKFMRFEAKVKSKFRNHPLFREGKIYVNRRVETTEDDYTSLADYKIDSSQNYTLERAIETQYGKKNLSLSNNGLGDYHDEKLPLNNRLWRKALQRNKFFRFNNLKKFVPKITSINEFINAPDFLRGVTITLRLPNDITVNDLSAQEKLGFVEKFLTEVEEKIITNYAKERGTTEFEGEAFSSLIDDYVLETNIVKTNINNSRGMIQSHSMRGKDWYIFDQALVNGLEYDLIKDINALMAELELKYEEVFLIRNERKVKVREFNGVRGFMPDFLLFLKDEAATYQVFIEPKGKHLKQQDKWKEDFLLSLNTREDITIVHESDSVKLIGLKFYSDEREDKEVFRQDFRNKLLPNSPSNDSISEGLFDIGYSNEIE
ncbi:DEAD/DEAH box helicase family protein [Bacillus sp. FJAT-27986]|uniref:DEAD/DEAH box helicase family protein n=1 Tax=Bacillus sp. FJAT-27986 TaxID=1743146 RepID=UPI00080AD8A5|nr:DEAD/DEAH box helicase family protein [Bacillus sp. FJAT-27986]OCA86158.1 restriction endonuclease subunit R [Bacillus sp. FJAT-27986]